MSTYTLTFKPSFTTEVVMRTACLSLTLRVTYAAKRNSELKALEDKAAKSPEGQQAILHDLVLGFDPVEVEGSVVQFGEGGLARLLDYPGVGPQLLNRFYKVLWEEALGN